MKNQYFVLALCLLLLTCIHVGKAHPFTFTIAANGTHTTTQNPSLVNKAGAPCDPVSSTITVNFIYLNGSNVACSGGELPQIVGSSVTLFGCVETYSTATFVWEMSDATGSFANPVILGEFINFYTIRNAFSALRMPAGLAAGTNYLLRVRLKNTSLLTNTLGPFTILPDASIVSLLADESGCPVKIQSKYAGSGVTLTGSNGYVFSYVTRNNGPNAFDFPVTSAGTYTLTSISQGVCQTSQAIQVSRKCP